MKVCWSAIMAVLSKIAKAEEGGTETPTPTGGASRYKSMLQARLRLIERVNKRERDINARTTEEAKNQLADRLKVIKDHFKKEMALYKRGSKKRAQTSKVGAKTNTKRV